MIDAYHGTLGAQDQYNAVPSSSNMGEEEDQSGHVVKIKLPYGYARALLQGDIWHYAACDALSAAGSRKTYTSNKVCLWKQKPENLAAFGTTGKIIKLDRQSVYCLRLDGITKLLKDKNLGAFVHYFEHHEQINPPPTDEGRALSNAKKQHNIQYLELQPEEQETHVDQHLPHQQMSHASHAWTVFNPVTGVLLHVAMCASCGVQDMRPAAALQCPLSGADPAPIPRTVALMQRQFQTLMEEMQAHFILMEDQFKELTVQIRAHFSAVQQQLAVVMAEHQRRQSKLRKSHGQAPEEGKRSRKRQVTEEKEQSEDNATERQEASEVNIVSSDANSEQAAKRLCDDKTWDDSRQSVSG